MLAIAVAVGAAGYDNGYDAKSIKGALISAGILRRDYDFSALYRTYQMKPLAAVDEQTGGVFDNLVRPETERCDEQAT